MEICNTSEYIFVEYDNNMGYEYFIQLYWPFQRDDDVLGRSTYINRNGEEIDENSGHSLDSRKVNVLSSEFEKWLAGNFNDDDWHYDSTEESLFFNDKSFAVSVKMRWF